METPQSAQVLAKAPAFAFLKQPRLPWVKVMEAMDNSGPWAKASSANRESGTLARTRRGRRGVLSELGILDYKDGA